MTQTSGLLYIFFSRRCPKALNNPSGDYHFFLHAASIYKRICSSRSDLWPISADLHSPSVFVNWADIRCIKNKNKRLKDPEIAQKFFLEMREQTNGSRAVIMRFFPRKCRRSSLAEYRDVTRDVILSLPPLLPLKNEEENYSWPIMSNTTTRQYLKKTFCPCTVQLAPPIIICWKYLYRKISYI